MLVDAVFDSSPLIFLDSLGYAQLLPELFSVWVTPTVIAELSAQPNKAAGSLASASWLSASEAKDTVILKKVSSLNLDAGESSAIALAFKNSWTVVLDDGLARKRSRALGLSVIGTLGVLLLLYKQGLLEGDLRHDIDRLMAFGMWLDDATIARVLAVFES